MASDMISRDALKDEMVKDLANTMRMTEMHKGDMAVRVLNKIDEAPAVDAVEVVRCKDCKHCAIDQYVKRPFCVLNGEVKPNGHIWFGVGVSEDHYCSHGARKEKKDAVD